MEYLLEFTTGPLRCRGPKTASKGRCDYYSFSSDGPRVLLLRRGRTRAFGAPLGDQVFHLFDERRHMVRDAVFDRPFNAAAVHALHVRVARLHDARIVVDDLTVVRHHVGAVRIHHAQILERVAVDDEKIGHVPDTHTAQSIRHADHLRAIRRRVLDDLERVKACFLVQLDLAGDAEAVERSVQIPGVVARRDGAAFETEFAERGHPDLIVLPPADFLRRGPAGP